MISIIIPSSSFHLCLYNAITIELTCRSLLGTQSDETESFALTHVQTHCLNFLLHAPIQPLLQGMHTMGPAPYSLPHASPSSACAVEEMGEGRQGAQSHHCLPHPFPSSPQSLLDAASMSGPVPPQLAMPLPMPAGPSLLPLWSLWAAPKTAEAPTSRVGS